MSPLLEALAITKSFGAVRALQGVSFDVRPGEVHALVGENGAGKSTLIKIITGAERADSGTLRIAGRDVPHIDPASARALGIAAIYQQPSLFPHLTVAENIALSLESGRAWRPIDWKRRREAAAAMLARVGASIDPERTVDTLSMPEQQIVEIAKAIGGSARVVLMDEPTASLTEREVEGLFDVVARLREQQVGVIYISHRLEEICGAGRPHHRAPRRPDGGDAGGRRDRSRRADSADGRAATCPRCSRNSLSRWARRCSRCATCRARPPASATSR